MLFRRRGKEIIMLYAPLDCNHISIVQFAVSCHHENTGIKAEYIPVFIGIGICEKIEGYCSTTLSGWFGYNAAME